MKWMLIIAYLSLSPLMKNSIPTGGQGIIHLNNPSFEEDPEEAILPSGWNRCSSRSTPDILPGPFGVELEPYDGESYVGLITRADGSHEHVLQRLHPRMKKNNCYRTSLYLAHSNAYAGYRKPGKLRVWLGNRKCKKAQLIFESPFIKEDEWKRFDIEFTSGKRYKYIYLEAWHQDDSHGYKSNILIDAIAPIVPCPRA